MKKLSDKERIYKRSKIDPVTSCWNWQGYLNKDGHSGYGSISVGSRTDSTRKKMSAHRFSFMVFKGEIPNGMFVCHTCDNPQCVNPDHLFTGTRQDNVDDRERKGRNKIRIGSKNSKILIESQVLEIRKLRLSGVKRRDIHKILGIKYSTIKDILTYRTWLHVIPTPPKQIANKTEQ